MNLIAGDPVPHPVLLSPDDLDSLGCVPDEAIFLGEEDRLAYFAIDLAGNDPSPPAVLLQLGRFRDLKGVAALLDRRDGALLAYARAMTHWHRRHQFCGDCGWPTRSAEGGHVRVCANKKCGLQHFPRTDPAVIVLVESGDQCLLGRQPIWPKTVYSTIAGFVEPGESVEEAVVREVFEETGIRVHAVEYHSSQPWPFPASLMLGFTARAEKTSILLDQNELEDARWFSRSEIRTCLENGTLRLPSAISIAYRLIEDWFDEPGSPRLRSFFPI